MSRTALLDRYKCSFVIHTLQRLPYMALAAAHFIEGLITPGGSCFYCFMIPVYTWDHEVKFIERDNAGYIQLITPNATNDDYQIMLFSNEDIAYFF